MLFLDIRGFSTFSEHLVPEVLVQLLNEYFNAMTQAVVADDGLVDKYIGDAILAVYGAPLPMPDHAYRPRSRGLNSLPFFCVEGASYHKRSRPSASQHSR